MNMLKDKTGKFAPYLKDIQCLFCDKKFHPLNKRIKFCSKECSELAVTKNHIRKCVVCSKQFSAKSMKTKFCSHECYGKTLVKEKVVKIKVPRVYKKITLVCNNCYTPYTVTLARKEKSKFCSRKCHGQYHCGEKSSHWKSDRESIVSNQSRIKQGQYKEWRTTVFKRDNYCCRLKNENCDGELQVHHILPWKDFPFERYNVNNGITLCYKHHPRKKEEVKNLEDCFRKLVLIKK
jgi:hypothetical protein